MSGWRIVVRRLGLARLVAGEWGAGQGRRYKAIRCGEKKIQSVCGMIGNITTTILYKVRQHSAETLEAVYSESLIIVGRRSGALDLYDYKDRFR